MPKKLVMPKKLLDRYPPGSDERQYHETLLSIVGEFEYDSGDVELGFALILFLEQYCFVTDGLDSSTHSAAGSTREDALFVSYAFQRILETPEWWLMEFLKRSSQGNVIEKCLWWKAQFDQSRFVNSVF